MTSLDLLAILALSAPTIALIAWAIHLERKRWRGGR